MSCIRNIVNLKPSKDRKVAAYVYQSLGKTGIAIRNKNTGDFISCGYSTGYTLTALEKDFPNGQKIYEGESVTLEF